MKIKSTALPLNLHPPQSIFDAKDTISAKSLSESNEISADRGFPPSLPSNDVETSEPALI